VLQSRDAVCRMVGGGEGVLFERQRTAHSGLWLTRQGRAGLAVHLAGMSRERRCLLAQESCARAHILHTYTALTACDVHLVGADELTSIVSLLVKGCSAGRKRGGFSVHGAESM